jgi:hypothetical protein
VTRGTASSHSPLINLRQKCAELESRCDAPRTSASAPSETTQLNSSVRGRGTKGPAGIQNKTELEGEALSVGLSGLARELRPGQVERAPVALGPDEGHERHEPKERDHHGVDDSEDDKGRHLREERLHAEVPFDSNTRIVQILKSHS